MIGSFNCPNHQQLFDCMIGSQRSQLLENRCFFKPIKFEEFVKFAIQLKDVLSWKSITNFQIRKHSRRAKTRKLLYNCHTTPPCRFHWFFFSPLENHVIHHSPMKDQQENVIHHSPMKDQQENPASLKTFHSNQIFHATVVNAPLILGFSRQKMPVSKRVHQDFPPQEQGSSFLFCFTYFAEIFSFIWRLFSIFLPSGKTFVYCTTESIIGSN